MRRPSRTCLSCVLVLCASIASTAQNLASIGREKPFSFSGGLSFNQILYASSGITARRDPYNCFASGSLNVAIYGWSVPLTFSVSNHNASFIQPFNQYSMHPTWKWITVHAGNTSMSLSPYTVNGHLFTGAGVELAPEGKWKFSALYGRFLKAIDWDSLDSRRQPSFQRTGYALKTTYGDDQNRIDIIVFHAEDNPASITQPADSLHITPQENFVVSVGGLKKIFTHLTLKAELAASALTKDMRAEKTSSHHPLARSGLFFHPRLSSAYYEAIKTSLEYQHRSWLMGIGYEHIDPNYRTLGAYYFNNDLENITLNGAATLMKEKLKVALSAGVQHDNVDKTKISTMQRIVSALNITATPSRRLNISASWSTFQTYTNIRSPFSLADEIAPYNIDTLNFTQISRNGALSGYLILRESETKKQNLTATVSWQEAADTQYAGSRFINVNAGYTLALLSRNTTIALMLNATDQKSPLMQTSMIGPMASVTKTFLHRKLRLMASSSMRQAFANGTNTDLVVNGRVTGAVAIRNKHSLNVSGVLVKRSSPRSTTEFTASIGYHYSFGGAGS